MIQQNEIMIFILGIGALCFIIASNERLKEIVSSKILAAAFFVVLAGWFFTLIEGVFWEEIFNLFEHICYAVAAILMLIWTFKLFKKAKIIKG